MSDNLDQCRVTVFNPDIDESSSSSLVNVSQLISFRQKSKLLLQKIKVRFRGLCTLCSKQ